MSRPDREDPGAWLEEPPRWAGRVDLDRLIRSAPHGVAAALVDLSRTETLAARSFERSLEADLDLLAEGAAELFRDTTVTALESLSPEPRADLQSRREAIQKVVVQSRRLLYVFLRVPSRPNLVLATLCRADANLGMVLMVARETLQEIEDGA